MRSFDTKLLEKKQETNKQRRNAAGASDRLSLGTLWLIVGELLIYLVHYFILFTMQTAKQGDVLIN